jgi:polysaccharide export outer membrane protein
MVFAFVLLSFSGCAFFDQSTDAGSQHDVSLDGALAGVVPMPFDGAKMSAADRADYDAANAAASDMSETEGSHFSEAGDPLLRTGLILALSVRVGDKLEVEPMRVQIMDKGEINLPMIGMVVCDGLTLPQLKRGLAERYGAFYRDPDISLNFIYEPGAVSPWGRVLVQGRVAQEGWVNIPPTRDLSVSSAIQLAGGYNKSAKKSAIIVTRRKEGGGKQVLRVDLERVGRKGEIERDIGLLPGDVIYVPESNY